MKLFIDSDGTLFCWRNDVSLDEIVKPGYFKNLGIYENVVNGIAEFKEKNPEIEIYIATHVLNYPHIVIDKKQSFQENIPFIKPNHIIYIPYGISKAEYIGNIDKNCYLLDDYPKNLKNWEDSGGKAIKMVNDTNSIPDNEDYIHYDCPSWMICMNLENIIKGEKKTNV